MEKYKMGTVLGHGAFGSVSKAINEKTGQVVAIKKMKKKYSTWQQCENQKQLKILVKLNHPNIVQLHELIKQNNQLHFVFEFMQRNVYELIQQQKKLQNVQIRNILYQMFQALAYMHKIGFFHRDLKPQNFMQTQGVIKLADFGLSREIRAKPPFTEYVSTRWYRSPEVLLRSRNYSSPMDIFAMGCIMAQLHTSAPLFPGVNEKDQFHKIMSVMGCPARDEWPQGYRLASALNIQLTQTQGQKLSSLVPTASPQAISLLQILLQVNPQKRPTASQVLQHPYFQVKAAQQKCLKNVLRKQQITNLEGIFQNVKYRPGYICE